MTEVTIEQGTLHGSTGTDLRGGTFFKFQGIPYAKPPVGDLRFKAPVPPEKWTGVFDATKEGSVCYHRDLIKNGALVGTENCLVLNVYTKNLPKEAKELRPVLFWIHGGGFLLGHGGEELYGPDFIITEDVVVVTINYRVGLLGFISFDDPSLGISGNAGLKDQVMALKWVQRNISKFGGDPNNVTIFGESAGGASVHLLVLSPMGKGLFHKAIAQSGCALNPWVRATKGAKRVAAAMGLEQADDKTVYNALMQKSTQEVLEIQEKMDEDLLPHQPRLIGLVMDADSKEPFMPEEPIKKMLSGNFNQIPFMMGCTSLEGGLYELFLKKPNQPDAPEFEKLIPWSFGYKEGTPESKAVAEKLKKFYLGDEEYSEKLLAKKYDIMSDVYFVYGIYVTILTQFAVSKAPTYFYRMTVETNLNFFKILLKIQVPGVCHCDDVGYLFKHFATPEIKSGSVEEVCLTRFVKLWTNFAKLGNPTPGKDAVLNVIWKPVTDANVDYLEIGKELEVKTKPVHENMQFWKQLFVESPAGQKTECCYLRGSK